MKAHTMLRKAISCSAACCAAAALLYCLPAIGAGAPDRGPVLVAETFSDLAPGGSLPRGWEALEFPGPKRRTVYSVEEEGGNRFLKAHSEKAASALYKRLSADLSDFPVLSWRWKVDNVISGANELSKKGDDYAARVYVTFQYEPASATAYDRLRHTLARSLYGVEPPGNAISYIWANRLAKGESAPNPYTGKVMMVALESGPELVGKWVAEERNILEDYRALFKSEPPKLAGIVVMTDTDNTAARAVAYYDDLVMRGR